MTSMFEMPASKLKAEIARILQDEGYIAGFKMVETPAERAGRAARQSMRMFLKYGPSGEKAISGLERVSRPGLRIYRGKTELPKIQGGLGTAIVSTPKGVMTDKQARAIGQGGEVLCIVA